MAALISKRILRSYASLHSLGRRCFDSPNAGFDSFHKSHDIYSSRLYGERVISAQRLLNGSMIQRFSTSILTPGSDEGAFPSDLLSKTPLATSERDIGLCQDLLIPVTNFHNEDKGFMVLAGDVFDLPIRKDIIHRVVLWQRAKRQQGTHSTKTISEVSGTGRKPWNQKGTGRARHGSLRGPQFRGGETKHGPKPRSHAFKLNKKVRRLGLKIALSARAAEGKLLVFEDLEVPTHKTKNFLNYFKQLEDTKKLLIVDGGPINEKLKLATQNLHYVNLLPAIGLNVYSILLHDTLVMSKEAVNSIVGRIVSCVPISVTQRSNANIFTRGGKGMGRRDMFLTLFGVYSK
ncbi:50S ribosomal protein L4, chloroplastic [Trifolium repens]|nr:50S ribosomal protein L4, chloroplastic [Trifolium repens]